MHSRVAIISGMIFSGSTMLNVEHETTPLAPLAPFHGPSSTYSTVLRFHYHWLDLHKSPTSFPFDSLQWPRPNTSFAISGMWHPSSPQTSSLLAQSMQASMPPSQRPQLLPLMNTRRFETELLPRKVKSPNHERGGGSARALRDRRLPWDPPVTCETIL